MADRPADRIHWSATPWLLVAIVVLTAGCPVEPDYSPELPGRDRTVYLNVDAPDTVVVVANDRTEVELDVTTNNSHGRALPTGFTYEVSPDPRYPATSAVADVATFSVDYGVATAMRPRAALLTIETRSDAAPGIYDYLVGADWESRADFSLNPPVRMRVVVVPTGGAIKTDRVAQISGGLAHTLVVLDDGTVWSFGDNQFGQLGDGTLVDRSAPVLVTGFDGPIRAVAAGRNHSVALGENGRVYTWGANDEGQLGVAWQWVTSAICPAGHPDSDHRSQSYAVPRLLITGLSAAGCDYDAPILEGVSAIAAGDDHTLALTADGVVSFGRNDHGQLGDQLANDGRDFVKTVLDLPGRPGMITAGGDFSLALYANGQVWGWGDSAFGQLGVGQHRDHLEPIDVAFTGEMQLLAAGPSFVMGRRRGEPGYVAWGSNSFGQLGDGTSDSSDIPRLLNTHLPISQVAAGDRHALATLPDGSVYTWGDNSMDQMGGATQQLRQLAPIVVPRLTGMSRIAAGSFHSLTRHNSCGTLYSWGRNLLGQLGQLDVSISRARPLPVYGLGEDAIGAGCELALRVWQRGYGVVTTSGDDFGTEGCEDVYCAAAVVRDRIVQLAANPIDGYELDRWLGDCADRGPTPTLTFDESKSCIVVYRPIPGFDAPPIARFAFSPSAPVAGQSVDFDASSSSDDGTIALYEWDFEDDGVFDANGMLVAHVFAAPGPYTVRLRVVDDADQIDETTLPIEIAPSTGGATLTLSFLGGGSGRVVSGSGGLDCTATCMLEFEPGSSIWLMPIPQGGSVFSHWGIDLGDPPVSDCDVDAGIEGCRVDMDGDRTVRIYFE